MKHVMSWTQYLKIKFKQGPKNSEPSIKGHSKFNFNTKAPPVARTKRAYEKLLYSSMRIEVQVKDQLS